MSLKDFERAMADGIISLPQDLKAMLRIVEDPDLEDPHRTRVAGAILHVLSSHNAVPGLRGLLAYVDDVIVLRLMLEELETAAADVVASHRESSPELFDPLEEQMQAVRAYLGDTMAGFKPALDGLAKQNHQGYTAGQCANDDEAGTWLYDAVQEAIVDELEFDEDEVVRSLKTVDQVKKALAQRL